MLRTFLQEEFTSSLSLGKYLRVGKLWILTLSTSLAVESILAITISSRSLNFSPSSSQIGASCLQCPHHGASKSEKRFTNDHGLQSLAAKNNITFQIHFYN